MTTHKRSIRTLISWALVTLVMVVGGCITWMAYQRTARMLEASVQELTQHAVHETSSTLEQLLSPARMGVGLLASQGSDETRGSLEARLKALPAYAAALTASQAVVSYYAADDAGNYFLVRRLFDERDRALFSAPKQTAFVVQSIEVRGAELRAQYRYFDGALAPLGGMETPESRQFDPRERPWYQAAKARQTRILTPPYRFKTSQKEGISIAQPAGDGVRIVGADIRLDTLGQLLVDNRITPSSRSLVLSEAGGVLVTDFAPAEGGTDDPVMAQLARLGKEGAEPTPLRPVALAGQTWRLGLIPLPIVEHRNTFLGVAIPEQEILAEARGLRGELLLVALGLLALALPMAFWLGNRLAQPLQALADGAEAMQRFDFTQPQALPSGIREVDALAQTLHQTRATLGQFLEILGGLSNEKDFQRLLPHLLEATVGVTRVEGGLLLLLNEDGQLRPAAGQWGQQPLGLPEGGALPPGAFSADQAFAGGKALAVAVAAADLQPFQIQAAQAVSVPLFDRERRPLGLLVLLSAQPLSPAHICFVEALSGFAAVALETRELIAMQKALFEAFIKVMAEAIDTKSPYTGGHCARVPAIAQLLAEAACAADQGPFADFQLSESEWETLHIAAWLHDCGKVTTPEYVVDKATKLETLYDRIHEVRMRFEVLKRDAEIDYLKALQAGQPEAEARATREARWQALDDEFAFVAECNQGGEFMAPDRVARLQQIASRTWQRTLDDRLGLSAEELRRKSISPAAPLPVLEPLLSDKDEHRFEHDQANRFGPGNPWGFTLPVPELKFHRGELRNLSIARGTLGDEERYKINEHIVQTIVMLSALPFPRHLRQVPEIAGGHHERMDGKGYPRSLQGADMSPLARIMAIADIFEALTASDRPYKSAKTLSESLKIMKRMAEEGHMDKALLKLFVESGAALRYAERFLEPGQIDTRDLSGFVPVGG